MIMHDDHGHQIMVVPQSGFEIVRLASRDRLSN
jgi:hypothetical protein